MVPLMRGSNPGPLQSVLQREGRKRGGRGAGVEGQGIMGLRL
jgi:hypothetical protein